MTVLILLHLLVGQAEQVTDSLPQPVPIRPPVVDTVMDVLNDQGAQIYVHWQLSPDDSLLDEYRIYRMEDGKEPIVVAFLPPPKQSFTDNNDEARWIIREGGKQLRLLKRDLARAQRKGYETKALNAQVKGLEQEIADAKNRLIHNGIPYRYVVAAVRGSEEARCEPSPEVRSWAQWFNVARINVLVAMVIFFALVLIFISQARKGKDLYLRKIAGLEAVDEAVGRATEMGRPILFVPGLSDIGDIATIAALNILQGVAKKAAQYDTPLIVPNRDPIVYTVAREIVKNAYSDVGRPDAFNPDSVFFITGDQFAFVSAVNGIMLREKPATNFFLGMFWAESLLLAETGNIAGAIQIAGTDASAQLPFFITACDYTIIGQELYAASAYLSREPNLVGTIKGQDWGQAIMSVILVLAAILTAIGLKFALEILTTV